MFRKTCGGLLALTLFVSACAAPTATPAPTITPELPTLTPATATVAPTAAAALEFVDDAGRPVKLAGPARRIVSLAPSNTEILFAVGAGEQVVGRDSWSDYPPVVQIIPSVDSSFDPLNTEAIVALAPDLVLAADFTTAEQIKALEDLGLTVYKIVNPVDLEGLYADLLAVGRLTGHAAEAQTLVDSLSARAAAVANQVKGAPTRPTVYYELDATDVTKPFTPGRGTFQDTLINLAGGENIAAGLKGLWPQISAEEIVRADPDIILLGDAKFGVAIESIGQRAGWENLKAVQAGQVYAFDDDLLSRPGPRLLDGLEELVKRLHPELFE